MLGYLSSFSDSFVAALIAWPVIAMLLTLPVLVWQYNRHNKLSFLRSVGIYLLMLYGLGLITFTLYPMPDNPIEFCRDYNLSPQLVPFMMVSDIMGGGLSAILQVVMNVIFFIPLGVFGRLLFGWRFRTVALVGLATSVMIETAQLTGGFGVYPCSYRLFDVDDMLLNTLGGMLGYGMAALTSKRPEGPLENPETIYSPGIVRRVVAFIIDYFVVFAGFVFTILVIYALGGHDTAMSVRYATLLAVSIGVFGLLPLLAKGWSLGGKVVHLNYDNRTRATWHRIGYYLLRTLFLTAIIAPPENYKFITPLLILTALIVWWRKKRILYQI